MKKRFLFVVGLLFCLIFNSQFSILNSQQLPNSSFENWEYDALNQWEDGQRPVTWNTSNIKKVVLGIEAGANMVFPDGNAHSGSYCAKAINTEVGAAGITETSPAWVTLGKPWSYLEGLSTGSATAGTDGGIQFTYRPDTIAVWIKRTSSGNENAHIIFYSWKGTSTGNSYKNKNNGCTSTTHYDEESDIRQLTDANECGTAVQATQIAEAMWRSKETFSDWTEIKIPIKYLSNDKPEKCNVIISAANYPNFRANTVELGAAIWADDVRLIYSSGVDEIYVDGRKKLSCVSGQFDYTCSMGKTATSVGEITLKRSGRWLDASEYTINKGAIGEVTTITVKAEDGSSTSTYKVTFAAAQSSNANLGDVLLNGISISGFNSLITSYNVELPFGTKAYPEIEAVLAEDGQKADVQIPSTFPGTVKISTIAPDGTTKKEYSITFTVGALTDNTLTDISLDGKTISGFNPTKNNYTVELPLGTTETPKLEYTTAYPNDHDIVVNDKGISGGIEIKVTPKGTTNTRTYKIKFIVTESTNSKLSAITLDGKLIDGFHSELLTYTVNLPIGTTVLPAVGFEKGDVYQTVMVDNGGFDSPTKITVKSQSGAQTIYRITFVISQSSISTLKDIQLDGVSIEGFEATKTSYKLELPQGTTIAPKITFVKGDEYQKVTFTEGGLTGVTRIVVQAQNGAVTTYTIEFVVVKSSNSKLNSIMLNGVMLEGFVSDITTYNVTLPRGTIKLPTITWTPGDASQTIRMTEGGVNGETKITVKAQTGDVTVYSIFFKVETNNNVNLLDVKVGGVSIDGFRADSLDYAFELTSGTTMLPEITYTKGDELQNVSITRGGVNGVTQILVRAEDGTTRVYTITFSVMKSENAFLKMIYVDSVALVGFDPEKLEYDYVLTTAVTECPEITVDKEDGQNISITVPRVTGIVRIEVTPESGSKNVYTININYPQSANSKLASILLDGVQIAGWNPEVIDYRLQITDGNVPTVTYAQGDEKQKVIVETNSITGDTKLIVKAENGTVTTYNVVFERVKSSVATLADLKIGGVSILDINKFDYEYVLSNESIELPAIEYIKGDEKQNVTLVAPALEGEAKLFVVSEDATDSTTYTINFAFQPSSNTDLEKIVLTQREINYEKIFVDADFATSDTVIVDWIDGVGAPMISYIEAEEQQMVALADAGLNGAEILVVAEDGSQREYVIRYNIVKTNIAQLADLQIWDSENHEFGTISGFNYDKYVYEVELPWRTTIEPVLNPVAMLPNQTIEMIYGGVNGATTIVVTAEDGVSKQIYTVNFVAKKSSIATLSAIYYNLNNNVQELPAFDADVFNYTIDLPYGTTIAPTLSWDLGEDEGRVVTEQRVEYFAGNLYQPSTIKVTAENGYTNTYTIDYNVVGSGKTNELQLISVGDIAVVVEEGVYDYEVKLPYGTTELPEVTVVKNFSEQSTFITSKGILGGTKIEVYSNKSTDDKVVYNLKYRVSKVSPASLNSVTIDGVKISNFDPEETTYILNVTTPPTMVEAEPIDGAELVEEPIYNAHKAIINVTGDGGNDERTYEIYFHYAEEKIPNGTFDQWGKAKYNNANKPIGWTVPADIADEYIYEIPLVGTDIIYNTGSEVSDSASFTKVYLQTCFGASLNGSVPGMMTLGEMSLSLNKSGNSTSSVSGGVSFHNTPEKIILDYNTIYNRNLNEWNLLLSIGSASNMKLNKFSRDYGRLNVWQKLEENIEYNVGEEVDMMNITINSAFSENAKDLGGGDEYASGLAIDNLRFYYNNLLSSITIDGVALEGFSSDKFEYTYNIEAERTILPIISVVGQVQDQQHRIVWGDEINGERIATITSMAEDGTTVDYKIKFVRGKSTNKILKALKVNGDLISGFEPNKLEYTCTIPNLRRSMPSIEAIGDNYNQQIAYTIDGTSSIIITVRAEDFKFRNIYKINFVEEKDDVTELKDISLDGYTLAFDAATTTYDVEMAAEAVVPYIYFEKTSEGQMVDVIVNNNLATLNVTAQDGTTKGVYTLNFVRPEVVSTAQLSNILLNDYQIDGFATDNYDYVYNAQAEPIKSLYYEKALASDVVTYLITPDSVILRVNSLDGSVENRYRIIYDVTLSGDATLESLTYDYRPMEGFTPALTDYPILVDRNEYPHIAAKTFHKGASIVVSYLVNEDDERVFAFDTESEDKTKVTTFVRMTTPKETSTTLGGIYFNGVAMRENGEGYTSSSVYMPEIMEYNIKLHSASPKMEQPMMPNITATAGEYGQKVDIENGGIDGDTYITVTSESGVEATYTLKFTPELSSNVRLNDLLLNYETIKGFQPKRYFYQIKLPKGIDMPVVSWQAADAFQTVEVKEYADRIDVVVTAEDGTSEIYQIEIEWLPSNETNIEAILSNGKLLEGFDPTIYDYFFDLPVGTMVEPMLKIVAGADGQSISITSGGVNGTTVIAVTAPDGVTKRDYRIHYNLLMSENNKLNMIYLDGEPLSGFTSDLRDYTIVLPVEKENPFVTWETGDDYQTVTRTIREDGTVVLKVVPQRAELYYEYIVRFEKVMSKNATLKSIEVDGAIIDGFASDKFTYMVNLPVGTENVPYISYTQAEESQTVHYFEPATINDVATIKVVAQDATYSNIYYVAFNRLLSEVDTLKTIFVGGMPIVDFDATTTDYLITLPYGTTELPNIEYEQGDKYQTVEVVVEGLNVFVVVTAENGGRRTYVVKFEIEKSSNSLLNAIYSNGAILSAFDSEVFDYEIELPYGTNVAPVFTYDLSESGQMVKYQPALSVADTAIFEVTAENGINKSLYRVSFKIVKSDNALLSNIFIGGEPLTEYARLFEADKSFSSEEFIYNIILPYGTEELPEVTWVGQVEDYASIVISGDSVRGKTIITVTSANEYNVSDYELNFDVRKSDNAYLKSLAINDMPTAIEFDSVLFEYVVTFPIGTDTASLPTVEDLIYEQILPTQTVVVSQNSPTELVILVTAEDGVAINAYQIKFEILLSNNTMLKNLMISGASIVNFVSTQYEYTYVLFPGAAVPEVDYEKGEESQNVDITYGNIDEPTYIYVEAEDGSLGTYVINFVTTDRNPGDVPTFDDVAWEAMGDGHFKASSLRDNVKVMIYTTDGTRVMTENVGLVDPNDDIRLPHDGGTIIYLPNNRQIYIYTFVYDNKVIASGKFVR
ncbi:MAG: hypothetical protein J6A44_03825 [Paludibacteraceae bacterium]|nr:hypothetical protein [Paludibacteraceae bacterium]